MTGWMNRSSVRWTTAIVGIIWAVTPLSIEAQVTALDGPSCSECRIVLSEVVTLGDSVGPGMLESEYHGVTRDSRGRYYLSALVGRFWVFDEAGTVIRQVGREGRGPGEYLGITGVLPDQSDSLFVFDAWQRRMTVLSPEYDFVRSVNLDHAVAGNGRLSGSTMLLANEIRAPGAFGQPFHALDRNGRIIRSFGGPPESEYDPRRREAVMRQIAFAEDGTFWAARINEYLIEHWDASGQLIEAITRAPRWFPRWVVPGSSATTAPVPTFDALSVQGDTLWVLVSVAGPDWSTAVRPSGRMYEVTDRDAYKQTVIEAIDLSSHTVIASTQVPKWLESFVGPGLVADMDTDDFGNPVVRIGRLSIRDPSR